MSIDLSQFHQVFFEESYEGLDVMESALLNIDISAIDDETINEIFRAAHSIKGGSATFGFNDIAEFTHVVETLLDLIRSNQFEMKADHVDLFLKSVDCIRTMTNQLENGGSCETTVANELKASFNSLLDGDNTPEVEDDGSDSTQDDAPHESECSETGWQIYFKPELDILRTGNDPVRMFRELAELGELSVIAITDDIPPILDIDPEACYMAWNLTLNGAATEAQINEVFEWVVDDSELVITPRVSQTDQLNELEESEESSAGEDLVVSAHEIDEVPDSVEPTKVTSEALDDNEKATVKNTSTKKEIKTESASIRVGTDKIDDLINMVGELVITQSMLSELGKEFTIDNLPKLMEGLAQLSMHTRELQENVMRIRMLPISFAFSRFTRLVHDMSKSLNKKVELVLLGEQTELDKTVMERIGDPLLHLVRNSLDHGLELPEQRLAAGKDEVGKITLNAFHQGGNIIIQIIDDGAGLNKERILSKAIEKGLVSASDRLSDDQINDLIFLPGFSTAEAVTDVSGRGVGMDVVRRNIEDLNGSVEIESTEGEGSVFTIRLPLTLAILDGQLIGVGEQVYIFPLISIVESIQTNDQIIHRVSGGCDVLRLRNEYIPIVKLWDVFNIKPKSETVENGLLVIVEGDNIKIAVLVDELLGQQQVVIKSIQDNYRQVVGVSGATILGDGAVSLILDISGLIKLAGVGKGTYKKISDANDNEAA